MKKLILSIIILLSVQGAFGAGVLEISGDDGFYRLSNGMGIILKPLPSSSLVAMNFCVRVGPIVESRESSGYSSVLSKLLLTDKSGKDEKTSNSLNSFSQLELLGVKTAVQLTNDFTAFTLIGQPSKVDDMLKVGAKGVFHYKFYEAQVEVQKELQLNEIFNNLSRPEYQVANRLVKNVFKKHPYRNPLLGQEESIQKMQLSSLKAFYDSFYLPSNSYLVIVGNFNEGDMVLKLEELSKTLSNKKVTLPRVAWEPTQNRVRREKVTDFLDYSYVQMGWPVPGSESTDKYVFHVISELLGGSKKSILWENIVNKKHGLFVGSSYYDSFHPFVFQVAGVMTPGKVDVFINEVNRAIKMVAGGEVGEVELERVKNKLISQDYFLREDLEYLSLNYGMYAIFNRLYEADEFGEGIRNVTLDDIRRVSSGFLDDTRLNVVRLEPESPSSDLAPEKISLKNNIRLILKENHDSPVVAVSIRVGAGSIRDSQRLLGLANLVASMLEDKKFAGGLSVGDKLEQIGANYEIKTHKEYVAIDLQTMAGYFEEAVDIVLETLLKPSFTSESLDLCRQEALEKLSNIKEDFLTYAQASIMPHLFPKSVFGEMTLGTPETLTAISLKDVNSFYRKYYVGQNIVVSVVGNFYGLEVKEFLFQKLSRFSGNIINEPAQQSVGNPKEKESLKIRYNRSKALNILAFRSISTLDARAPALDILRDILCKSPNSRFRKKFAANPSIYEVSCDSKSVGNEGYFYLYGICEPNYLASMTETLKAEIESLYNDGFTKEEFDTAKERVLNELSFKMVRNIQRSDMFATDEIVGKGFDYYLKYPVLLDAVTESQVSELITKSIFKNHNYVEATLAP